MPAKNSAGPGAQYVHVGDGQIVAGNSQVKIVLQRQPNRILEGKIKLSVADQLGRDRYIIPVIVSARLELRTPRERHAAGLTAPWHVAAIRRSPAKLGVVFFPFSRIYQKRFDQIRSGVAQI